ncbi:hypothetical protein G7Y89_g12599 [Cudoniella acicularis]|uniref:aldehyde dehydrogenase (NAD(+)) n=1 Tax=Cudoniella acicularis TaxID=354080 RepID=A0A8H4RB80_9HELO|nr:hypothetical protein G7Y89_g12599 [Cudoniella acicularis]
MGKSFQINQTWKNRREASRFEEKGSFAYIKRGSYDKPEPTFIGSPHFILAFGFSALSPHERGKPLKAMAAKILESKPELAHLEARSVGKPVYDFFDGDYAAVHFNYFGEAGYAQGHTSLNTPGFLNMSLRQPFGVVGIIIQWNTPLVFFSKKVAPAVAAGNTVVLKSSEKAPLTSWKVAQWIAECGFPLGVINVLPGHGHISGSAMSLRTSVPALSFTGRTRIGRAIQIASAQSNLKKVVFELSKKGPALVFEDADLDEAVKGTEHSIYWNSGQTSMANSRVYVPDKVQYETVLRYIDIGKESGRVVLSAEENATVKKEEQNIIVHPVIFVDQPEHSRIMKEEIFGPGVVINTFKTEEEVISKANDTEFGLYAALYTKDLERALRVGKKLESGMIGVNCASPTGSWDLPFGGWKGSGTGRESLLESMDHFLEQKSIYIKVPGIRG